ncbi:MAG: response regulator [Acidobacteriota bacterium]
MTEKLTRILIAEDDDNNRIPLKMMLKMNGYEVIEACDGQQALDYIQRDKPDLVLMDISLPVIDGLEVTRLIRREAELQTLPIIFISGYENQETLDRVKACGGTGYISKPIEFDDLKQMIEKHLNAE